jgi:DNA polymerase III subunit delta'
MSWDSIIGQPRVVDVLSRAVAAGRVAHAYLFHGPDGTGKRAAALALAQALQCERRQPGDGDACGACGPCQKVQSLLHPDVHVYLAQPSKATPEDVGARLRLLAENPYVEISYSRRPELSDSEKPANLKPFYAVDRVREINRDLRFTPAEGRWKVALLTDVDTMQASAANAFLKSLEEPTPRTVLILTASRADLLLPTIISRCQRLRFDPLAAVEIEEALRERIGAEPVRAALLARMADGSYTQALSLLESVDLDERRQQVLLFFRHSYRGALLELDDIIQELAKLGREPLRDVLQLMLTWVRDLVLARTIGPGAPLINVDQREAIEKFVANVERARLADMAGLVEHALDAVAANASTTLVLMSLADGLRDAMLGLERSRLFTPLAEA